MTAWRTGAAAAALMVSAASGGAAPGTSTGVYTADQAALGAVVYVQRCAMCHGAGGQGTWEVPALKGSFMANWGKGSVGALSDYIGRAMPQFAPGTLDDKDRTDVVAYLLQINGQPSGAKALPADAKALAAMPIDAVTKPTSR